MPPRRYLSRRRQPRTTSSPPIFVATTYAIGAAASARLMLLCRDERFMLMLARHRFAAMPRAVDCLRRDTATMLMLRVDADMPLMPP
jgi:hypothetical protein